MVTLRSGQPVEPRDESIDHVEIAYVGQRVFDDVTRKIRDSARKRRHPQFPDAPDLRHVTHASDLALLEIEYRIEVHLEADVVGRCADSLPAAEVTQRGGIGEVGTEAKQERVHRYLRDAERQHDSGVLDAKIGVGDLEQELSRTDLDAEAVVDHVLVPGEERGVDLEAAECQLPDVEIFLNVRVVL